MNRREKEESNICQCGCEQSLSCNQLKLGNRWYLVECLDELLNKANKMGIDIALIKVDGQLCELRLGKVRPKISPPSNCLKIRQNHTKERSTSL